MPDANRSSFTMAERVYIETSVVSYPTARASRDVIVAGHQQTTHDWWDGQRLRYELCHSQLVVREAGDGDRDAAGERLAVLQPMTKLEISEAALFLAEELVRAGALPKKAENDALHIAIAAVNRIPDLLTWNCKHMANAHMRTKIELTCKAMGLTAPIVCTPEEMMDIEL